MAEGKEELKSLLMTVKEDSEKAGLNLVLIKYIKLKYIKKTNIMISDPIISRQIEWEKVEAVTVFSSWALKLLQMLTADIKLEDDWFLTGKL